MKKELLIIGAGNVGGFLAYNIEAFGDYKLIGFLDDDTTKHGKMIYGTKVVGSVDEISRYMTSDLHVVIGISSPSAKSVVENKLAAFPLTFPNFIGEGVWISKHVSLGKGVILYPGTMINYEAVIGDFVIANMNCSIGHNCYLGKYSSLAPGVNLGGFTHVEEGVDLGIGVSTRQGVRIGRRSRIGGQSMLVRDVSEGSTIVGVPGRQLKTQCE